MYHSGEKQAALLGQQPCGTGIRPALHCGASVPLTWCFKEMPDDRRHVLSSQLESQAVEPPPPHTHTMQASRGMSYARVNSSFSRVFRRLQKGTCFLSSLLRDACPNDTADSSIRSIGNPSSLRNVVNLLTKEHTVKKKSLVSTPRLRNSLKQKAGMSTQLWVYHIRFLKIHPFDGQRHSS